MDKTVKFKITGATPILLHADDVVAADRLAALRARPGNKSTAGDDRSPAQTWMSYLYFVDGFVAIPAPNLMSCLLKGGTAFKLSGRKTLKEATQTAIFPQFIGAPIVTVRGKTVSREQVEAIMRDV